MFSPIQKSPHHLKAVERLKTWTRERFQLGEGSVIFAAELACPLPGCPPLETAVTFWNPQGQRYHFKIFKAVEDIAIDDLPYRWLLDALAVPEGVECDCC